MNISDIFHFVFDRKGFIKSQNNQIVVRNWRGSIHTIPFAELSGFPRVQKDLFSILVKIPTKYHWENHRFSRFSKVYKTDIETAIDFKAIGIFVGKAIVNEYALIIRYALKEFLRDSSIEYFNNNIVESLKDFSGATRSKYIPKEVLSIAKELESIYSQDDFPRYLRQRFEVLRLQERKHFYDKIEANPLTTEQRYAVVRENDRNLVLAAAGTGKTSVMVAKALDLIESRKLDGNKILVLAFNNAAAKELRTRISQRAEYAGVRFSDPPTISTFHALGRKILKDTGIDTHISVLAEDNVKYDKWVYDWLVRRISVSTQEMKNFIAIHYHPANPFDFKSNDEYERYVRDNEKRALSGDLVRGYQELLIANWLYLNGIKFEYEPKYKVKIRFDVGIDYRPDFHVTGTHIFIEHFGIDRAGNTRPDIDAEEYKKSMLRKRTLHAEQGTLLLETYHYDWCEGNLLTSLERQLKENGITPNPIEKDEIFEALNNSGVIDNGAKILQKSLNAIRIEQLNDDQIIDRLRNGGVSFYTSHAELLVAIHNDYVDALRAANEIDFDDMIIRAANCIEEGMFRPPWEFILVDEFQDISGSRMNFLKNLIASGPNPKITVVGDDWQSIYRFAGGKLELTTRFTDLVGSNTNTKLQKTFRYNNSIADTAGTFIMENKEQYHKHVTTEEWVNRPQIYLLDCRIDSETNSMAIKADLVVSKIREKDSGGSIAILSRYNYLLDEARQELKKSTNLSNVNFWTFHGSKGLESDYCVLIGLSQGKLGFPNENKDDIIVEALLPTLDSYPHSEERRLMYVALTRARHKVYLIADPTAPSAFVNELLSPKYKIHIYSKSFRELYRRIFKCPSCSDGYFKKMTGKYGEFYVCSSNLACKIKPRICADCGSPSIDDSTNSVCTNPSCRRSMKICPRCGRPMKIRHGQYGEFYGCTGYGLEEDRCTQKIKIH